MFYADTFPSPSSIVRKGEKSIIGNSNNATKNKSFHQSCRRRLPRNHTNSTPLPPPFELVLASIAKLAKILLYNLLILVFLFLLIFGTWCMIEPQQRRVWETRVVSKLINPYFIATRSRDGLSPAKKYWRPPQLRRNDRRQNTGYHN